MGLDSHTSFYATLCMECFSNYQKCKFAEVYFYDNKDILLSLKGGVKWILKYEVGAAMLVEDRNLELWHQRLDHMRKKGLVVMHKSEQL